jgi:type I restriction enzyme S subunit
MVNGNAYKTQLPALDPTGNLLHEQLVDLGLSVSVPTTFSSHWLYEGESRLDANFYGDDAVAALRVIQDCNFEVKPLQQVTRDVYILGRFRRVYATNKEAGYPYLSASEALTFRPTSDRYIAKDHSPQGAVSHFVEQGQLLVSCSGSVGRLAMVTKRLEKFFLTHDLIRISSDEASLAGYLYAYLSSWVGQALLSKDQYGSAIKHLEPHHIAGVPVPLLPIKEQQNIHNGIVRAYALRDEANDLLDEADLLLHNKTGLLPFDESLVPYLPVPKGDQTDFPEVPHPRAFTAKISDLTERFDASYHLPVSRTVVEMLHKSKYQPVGLGQLAGSIFIPPRFKRIYVDKEHGVPFLQGSHLPQMRPYDLKYLSKKNTRGLERWAIHKRWVLVTCSGTIGRVGIVSSLRDEWTASQHLLRIIPDEIKGHPGYIAAFLMTPYGQHQLTAKVYGGVVDELTEADTASVWIPNAPKKVQANIGDRVVEAFEKKDEASTIEAAAIEQLERLLERASHKQADLTLRNSLKR